VNEFKFTHLAVLTRLMLAATVKYILHHMTNVQLQQAWNRLLFKTKSSWTFDTKKAGDCSWWKQWL